MHLFLSLCSHSLALMAQHHALEILPILLGDLAVSCALLLGLDIACGVLPSTQPTTPYINTLPSPYQALIKPRPSIPDQVAPARPLAIPYHNLDQPPTTASTNPLPTPYQAPTIASTKLLPNPYQASTLASTRPLASHQASPNPNLNTTKPLPSPYHSFNQAPSLRPWPLPSPY